MAWIEYHSQLRDHWKISRLAAALKSDYLYALGAMSCLWLWATEYAQKGELKRFSDEEIRIAARCNREKFSKKVLTDCELIDEKERINDWNQHGIKLLESRRKRQREYMQRKRDAKSRVYVDSTSTKPNQTIPNHTLPNLTNLNQDPGIAFWTPEEIEGLKTKIVEVRKCQPQSMAFDVCLKELQLKMAGKNVKNRVGYAISILEKEKAA